RARKPAVLTAVTVATALALAPIAPAPAQEKENRGPPVLRDAESEALLREYTRPILRAAGLEKQNIQMVIINDSQFNAFVADGRRIFVNYGAMMQSETPNQIIAMLLGAGAMVAGARGGAGSGLTNAGAAAFSAPGEMIKRNLLSYVRQQ